MTGDVIVESAELVLLGGQDEEQPPVDLEEVEVRKEKHVGRRTCCCWLSGASYLLASSAHPPSNFQDPWCHFLLPTI